MVMKLIIVSEMKLYTVWFIICYFMLFSYGYEML